MLGDVPMDIPTLAHGSRFEVSVPSCLVRMYSEQPNR
jgi:hypothetical protein